MLVSFLPTGCKQVAHMSCAFPSNRPCGCSFVCLLMAYSVIEPVCLMTSVSARNIANLADHETLQLHTTYSANSGENVAPVERITSTVEVYSHKREMLMASALSRSCTASSTSRKLLHQRGAARRLQALEDIRTAKRIQTYPSARSASISGCVLLDLCLPNVVQCWIP